MNKAFYIVLFFSIVLIFSASVYLINRKAPPGPLSNQPGFTQIYTAKPGGRMFSAMYISGGNCESDGIRFNIANEHTLVDRESTWIFTLHNDPKSCTDKPWWSPKIGSHGSTSADQASGLYEASVPYDGGFHLMRTEGPSLQYHPCSGYQYVNVPPSHGGNNPQPSTFIITGDSSQLVTLGPGTFTITEHSSPSPGTTIVSATFSGDCMQTAPVPVPKATGTISVGQHLTCSITNTVIQDT